MKIPRVNITIPTIHNKHRPYLYNEMLDMMNVHHFGGEFRNESIKLNSMPKDLLNVLRDLKIRLEVKK